MEIVDTGSGIAEDRIQEIFRPYSQSKLGYRKHGGTGLGLAILANLVRFMKGTLHVISKEGYGSTFVVYLPMAIQQIPGLKVKADSRAGLREGMYPTPATALLPSTQVKL
jgi:signal transduction histidine kinase